MYFLNSGMVCFPMVYSPGWLWRRNLTRLVLRRGPSVRSLRPTFSGEINFEGFVRGLSCQRLKNFATGLGPEISKTRLKLGKPSRRGPCGSM